MGEGSEPTDVGGGPLPRRAQPAGVWSCPGCGMAIRGDEPRVSLDIGVIAHTKPQCANKVRAVLARDMQTLAAHS